MTAAVITPGTVGKFDKKMDLISGTARRHKQLYLSGTKAAQNDWFLLTTYLSTAESTQITGWRILVEASGNAYEIDVGTYDSDDGKLDLTAAATGTVHVYVDYYE